MTVHRHIQGLVQYIVYPSDRSSRQRSAAGAAFLLEFAVQALDISGGDFADLLVTEVGFDKSLSPFQMPSGSTDVY